MPIWFCHDQHIGYKGTEGLQYHIFFICGGKQHPKNIWFRSVLIEHSSFALITYKLGLIEYTY